MRYAQHRKMALGWLYRCILITIILGKCDSLFGVSYGEVTPENPYLFVGEQLILNCTLDPRYTSDQVFFTRRNDEKIDGFVTNITTDLAELNMTMAFLNDSTTYQCWLNVPNGYKALVGGQSVTVEYYPQTIQDLFCVVNDWKTMTCNWSLAVEYSSINNIAVQLLWTASGNISTSYSCIVKEKTSCHWSEEEFNEQISFNLNITVLNTKREVSVMSSHVITASLIVKPAKAENLRCDQNGTCITVSWTRPAKWKQLIYRIGNIQFLADNSEDYSDVKELNHTICNMIDVTECSQITFQVKPKQKGFWSDPVTVLPTTAGNEYPQKVKNLSCIVNDWETMTCNWSLGVEYKSIFVIDVKLVWTATGARGYFLGAVREKTSCYWSETEYSGQQTYVVNITVQNTRMNESVMSSHVIIADNIVKPARVESLQNHVSSTCVNVSYSHPASPWKKLKYRVGYTHFSTDNSENQIFFETTDQHHVMCNLKPFTEYRVSVSAKPDPDGFWSDPCTVSCKTKEDVPAAGPNVTDGSYTARPCQDGERVVTIYLKAPKKEDQNGILTTYTAQYRQLFSRKWEEKTVDAAETTLPLNLMCGVDYEVRLYAGTSAGVSKTFSRLRINKEETVASVKDFRIELVNTTNTNSEVVAKWDLLDIDFRQLYHYTVYWCSGSKQTLTCDQKGFEWLTVPGGKDSVTLPLLVEDIDKEVNLFAISIDSDDGSSGITWAECIYVKDNTPSKMSGVKLAKSSPDLTLTVAWVPAMCHNQAFIVGYVISYCQCIKDAEGCQGPFLRQEVKKTENRYTIHGLQENHNYSIAVASISTGGTGIPSDPVFGIPLDTSLKTGQIVGIACAASLALLLFVAGFIWFLKWCRRQCCGKMKVTLPSVDAQAYVKGIHISNINNGHGSMKSSASSDKQKGDKCHSSPRLRTIDVGQGGNCGDKVIKENNTGFKQSEGSPSDYLRFTTVDDNHTIGSTQIFQNAAFVLEELQDLEMMRYDENTATDASDNSSNGSEASAYVTVPPEH